MDKKHEELIGKNKLQYLNELYSLAMRYGIRRSDIGAYIFGKKEYSRIYQIRNPQLETVINIEKNINEMIDLRKKGKIFDIKQ
jgi:hypothetical protein